MNSMKLLGTFARDGAALGDYASYKSRTAGRAVIFDGQKVALLYVSNSGYYTLPGGGIESDDIQTGLAREVLEETGCTIVTGNPVGSAIIYFERWQTRQTDYCYIARKANGSAPTNHTQFELSEGYRLLWAHSLDAAIALAENTSPENWDGKLVRARDLLFLKATRDILL